MQQFRKMFNYTGLLIFSASIFTSKEQLNLTQGLSFTIPYEISTFYYIGTASQMLSHSMVKWKRALKRVAGPGTHEALSAAIFYRYIVSIMFKTSVCEPVIHAYNGKGWEFFFSPVLHEKRIQKIFICFRYLYKRVKSYHRHLFGDPNGSRV